jgi:hypothetical protein
MPCQSILAYSNNCAKATVSGISQLFLISFNDLKAVTGTTDVYALATNGMVNQIALANSAVTKFVKIGILPKAVAIKDSYKFDQSKGIADFSQELTLPVANVSVESRKLMQQVVTQSVVALVKLTSGTYIALGLDGMMQVTSAEGAVTGSDNGYNVTFSAISGDFAPIVDPTIVAALIA